MIEAIIRLFKKYIVVWIIALISFISGLGVMSFYGHKNVAIAILIFVMFVAIMALIHIINLTNGEKDK